ncbi:MAG: CoA pyrophosphatase [Ideonella sp.]|nr:CoA pyrophosphatase [Ideonella sp.]
MQRFACRPAAHWQPVIQGDAARLDIKPDCPPAQAAVLLPLVVRDGQVSSVVLTRRTAHLKRHAGQISFPGGTRRARGRVDAVATALREAQEEVGLVPQSRSRSLATAGLHHRDALRGHAGGGAGRRGTFKLKLDAIRGGGGV